MKMNRRNVLVGLGGLAIGGGALFGSGAFDQVEAERDVTVETTDDADALLAIDVDDDYEDISSGVTSIDLSDDNLTSAQGLNPDAETTFEDMLTITNNGTQEVTVNISVEEDDGLDDLTFEENGFTLGSTDSETVDMTVETPTGTDTFAAEILIDASSN